MDAPPATDAHPDVEFFFDPICPFAWQTSKWIRVVREAADISVRWRFISLYFLNKVDTPEVAVDEAHAAGHRESLGWHRILCAVRDAGRDDLIEPLYVAWTSERYERPPGSGEPRSNEDILRDHGLDLALAEEAGSDRWDAQLRDETEVAIGRTGPDVGTPILTFLPGGNSYFGPVISSVPERDDAVAIYEALRVLVDFESFSEIKRTARPALDLPAFAS